MKAEPEMRAERDDAPAMRTPSDRTIPVVLWLAAALVVSVVALWLWSSTREGQPPVLPPAAQAPAREVQPPVAQPEPAKAAGAPVQHPVATAEQPLDPQELPAALSGLLGNKAAASFLHSDRFALRFAATVDSLGREHSVARMWPVLPTPGRFVVEERAEGTVIAAENAARYTPLVLLAGTVDVAAAVRLYRRMYPLLQQAYRELGFGGRYLNDRVVEVIDILLATPEAPEAPRVELVPVKGPVPSLQPWVRYQFVDPELEALAAGQKILVRVGPVNQRRLKSKLAELRRELTLPAVPAAAAPASR